VLNDMMKVKGHIAEMARCLEDPDPRVASVARLLFHELSRKHGNPIYNLLPDLLSRLSGDAALAPDAFQRIMTRLLGFIDKDRQTESLADKFTNRFAEAALASTPKPARDVAFCLSQLALSDKAFRKFMEQWKLYEPALYDKEVYSALCGVVAKAKKSYGGKSKSAEGGDAARVQVEEFEAKMHAAHVERYESWRTQRRAEGHVFDDDYEERLKAAEREAEAEAAAAAEGEAEDGEDEHPLGPLKAREEEADEADEDADEDVDEEDADEDADEEEEENDENDPAPSPAPVKKTSRRAAPKAKKADAVKAEEAPARSSRRALRANR
jgi:condensin complex subunit 1